MNKELFGEFPPVPTEEWESQIREDLKGADFYNELIWKTIEGIDIRPFYRSENLKKLSYLDTYPGDFPYVRGPGLKNSWDIRQNIITGDFREANNKARYLVEQGVNSIGFDLTGRNIKGSKELEYLIENLDIEPVSLNFIAGKGVVLIAEYLRGLIKSGSFKPGKINASLDFDPLGELTLKGSFYEGEKEDFTQLRSLIEFAMSDFHGCRVVPVNGLIFSNAGASVVEQLGFMLAVASEYLSRLTEKGLAVEDITGHMHFSFGVGPNYFMEIARLRAARLLWSKIVEAYGAHSGHAAGAYIHSETTKWNMTVYDPYTNILRATTESMSAVLGGTDSLLVNTHDCTCREPSEFSERIARNIQHILKEESYFNKVTDPSAGSYYIENLTDMVAEKAWSIFLAVENIGGYIKSLEKGYIQSVIDNTVATRKNNIATGDEVLLGTNRFPDFNESAINEADLSMMFPRDMKVKKETKKVEPLKLVRGAEQFEKLRLSVESSARPAVFMLTCGDANARRARAIFATNFFACGGFKVEDNLGFATVEEGIKEAKKSRAQIVVICSADNAYATIAPEIYDKLKNRAIIVVAGLPESIDELRKKGIEHFIYSRMNMLDELKKYHNLLKKRS
jgi:methylmalonyl-CoA mutase